MSEETQAIVFDVYGTLLDIASIDQQLKNKFQKGAEKIGPLWRAKQLEYSWLRTLMDRYVPFSKITLDALKYAVQAKGMKLEESDANDLLHEYNKLVCHSEVPDVLAKLSGRLKMAVLSNADENMLKSALSFNMLENNLDAIISANSIKTFKPHPQVYQLAVTHLKVPKENILFISSNPWDVAGAKSFGFQVSWVNRQGKTVEELGVHPDRTISSLSELVPLLTKS